MDILIVPICGIIFSAALWVCGLFSYVCNREEELQDVKNSRIFYIEQVRTFGVIDPHLRLSEKQRMMIEQVQMKVLKESKEKREKS